MLNIVKFIIEHPHDWEALLTSPPYSLSIKRKDTRILFKYSQIESDFSLDIVKEARGLILEDKTWKVICYPFNKFFNFGEEYADNIDWESAVVETKEDGSLIKIYFYNDEWKIATNGTIDAEDAELQSGPYKNFRQLFDAAAEKCHFDFSKLNRYFTYCCEICSEFNIIICPQSEMRLIHIGTRNNRTFQEVETDIGIPHPQKYALSSLEDCIAMAKTFDFTKEGFVVKDKNYNRIKVKSEDYVRVHRLANNGSITLERAIDLIRMNEIDEFVSYFPNYTFYINNIRNRLAAFRNDILFNVNMALIGKMECKTRKDFAATAKTFPYPAIWFKVYDSIYFDVDRWIAELSASKLAQYLEKK
jgi:hypothetical protein